MTENKTIFMNNLELARVLEKQGYSFWNNGEFQAKTLEAVAFHENYELDDKNGWVFSTDTSEEDSNGTAWGVLIFSYETQAQLDELIDTPLFSVSLAGISKQKAEKVENLLTLEFINNNAI